MAAIDDRADTTVNDAIILAAGHGSRLQAVSHSKPLAQVGGLTLIEIAVRQAIAAGVEAVTVVTGHAAAEVEAELRAIDQRVDARIQSVRLDDWSKPNGHSVIAGAEAIRGPFLLIMADHIFGDGILEALAKQSLGSCDVVLAVDRIDNPLVDPEDATWVATGNGKIIQIGKTIAHYDVVDCGAFLANAALPKAIEKAIAAGKPGSLSDGMQVLADAGGAETMDVAGQWWIDVDDPRAHELAQAQAADHLALFSAKADACG